MNFTNNFNFFYSKNFIFDYKNNYIINLFKDKNQKIYCLKERILINVNLIFTHNEETYKQFLINFKNNKIQSTFNFINLKK